MDRGGKKLLMMMMMMIRGGGKKVEKQQRELGYGESWEEDKINSNSSTGATAEILIAVELLVINAGNRTLLIITKESSKLELKSIDLLHLCGCVCAVCSVQQQQQQQQFH
jgi:hypothetical protein